MMKKIFIKILAISLSVTTMMTSCMDMDIPPTNMLTEDNVFDSSVGVTAYLASLYSQMPLQDKRYSVNNRYNASYIVQAFSCITGEAIGRDQDSQVIDQYWDGGYSAIRAANLLIESLPKYASYHSEADINNWMGEAYFIRAMVYITFAQRYGGISLVTEVLNYGEADLETFMIPRSSEEDTWKLIESDLQFAIDNCYATSSLNRVNKYTAAAYKASAMLHAASIANFNDIEHYDTERGIRLCGIDKDQAAYFYKSAYEAAKLFDDGPYSLYRGDWKDGDKDAQYENFVNIHQVPENCETIYMRSYGYPDKTHSWDALYGPLQLRVDGLSGGVHPTLEFVELFDGIEKNENGEIKVLNDDGTHIMYDDPFDIYENVEPRLRATVILPNDEFKGEQITIYRGIYTPEIPSTGLPELYDRDEIFDCTNETNMLTYSRTEVDAASPPMYTKIDGSQMEYAGLSGTFNSYDQGSSTGFLLRKNLDINLEAEYVIQNRGDAPWIDKRYAEVLLCRAEAAYELAQLGDPAGSISDAVAAIDDIRQRAGCTTFYNASTLTRDVIRDEFFREMAFENKGYWNLVRWRTYHQKHLAAERYHAALPVYAGTIDKWFYIVKYTELAKTFTFNASNYYIVLPENQISANPNIVQNPN